MNLAERRVVQGFQIEQMPAVQASVDSACGKAVPIEVAWDTLVAEGMTHILAESWKQIYFDPLTASLAHVARDDLGKQALSAGVTKIVVRNSRNHYYPEGWASFEDGVLTLDHDPTTNANDADARAAAMTQVLETAL